MADLVEWPEAAKPGSGLAGRLGDGDDHKSVEVGGERAVHNPLNAPELRETAAPNRPMDVARDLMPAWTVNGLPTLRYWRGGWMVWQRTHWTEVDAAEVRACLYRRLEKATFVAVRVVKGEEVKDVVAWAPTKRKIADLMEALASIVILPATVDPPSWTAMDRLKCDCGLNVHDDDRPVIACANGLLDVTTGELHPLTPGFFNLVSVPFAYDPDAPEPTQWLSFLGQLWPATTDENNAESIKCLQEWAGYILSGRTDLQKMLLIVGPTRSGKGTIARILTRLIGKKNVAGPSLASLATNFGMSPLLGKPLAIVSDARLTNRSRHDVVEQLLRISGEDAIDVDRKHRDPWTGKLPTRIMILSNELPNFGDDSGTIANRFVVLSQQVSFLGREDRKLTDKLATELPGILVWALRGLERLTEQGHFTEPPGMKDAIITMMDAASPVGAFVRERCKIERLARVEVDDLFAAWKTWCEDNEQRAGTKQVFARNLKSVAPGVRNAPRGWLELPSGDKPGKREPRAYLGIRLDETRNSNSSGPSRSTDDTERSDEGRDHGQDRVDRDGPQQKPLWDQHGPQRVQVVGGKVPDGALYVGRAMPRFSLPASPYANPHVVGGSEGKPCRVPECGGRVHTRDEAIALFRDRVLPSLDLTGLAGRDLACWCPLDLPCHADLLLAAAREGGAAR